MKTSWTLLCHELRGARSSLVASAALTIVLLAILHTFGGTATDSATGLPLLWCLCALQFSSDSFATDLASGRLATRAALPVSARTLWWAKLAGFCASIVLLASFGIAIELVWQSAFGIAGGIREFLGALPPPSKALPVVALIGSAGMLCSLLVESALTAMLLTGLVLGALWGLWQAIVENTRLGGPNALSDNPLAAAFVIASGLLVLGQFAFARAQRRLGDETVRVRTVLMGALVLTLGMAGTVKATSLHWSAYGLEDQRMQIFDPIASPDGRFIAFESEPTGGRNNARLSSAWVLDLDTGECRLIAGPGMLVRNGYCGGWQAWSEQDGVCVLAAGPWLWAGGSECLRVHAVDGELRQETIADTPLVAAPRLPDWASVKEMRAKKYGPRELWIRSKDLGIERSFEGALGRDVFISPTPGRILLRRDKRLVLVDFEPAEERVLIGNGVGYSNLSPDGQVLLVRTEAGETHAISMADGSALHVPWTRHAGYIPRWIYGDDRSHMLHLSPMKPTLYPRILDLDTGREIEVADHMNDFFARVADRGYVMIDERGNLVWIDLEGKPVKVLIDRGHS